MCRPLPRGNYCHILSLVCCINRATTRASFATPLCHNRPLMSLSPLYCSCSFVPLQLKRYNESLLSKASELNSRWKWEDKRQEVFARFSNYRRHVHVNMPGLERKGAR